VEKEMGFLYVAYFLEIVEEKFYVVFRENVFDELDVLFVQRDDFFFCAFVVVEDD
jgi:hypothetical protein